MSTDIVIPTKASLVADLTAAFTTALGSVGDFGDFIDAFVDTLLDVWSDASDVEDALERENAIGAMAEFLAGVFGVSKLPVEFATAEVYCTGDDGTVIPAGSLVATVHEVPTPADLFPSQSTVPGSVIMNLLETALPNEVFETSVSIELSQDILKLIEPTVDDDLLVGDLFTTINDANTSGWVFECTTAGNLGATNSISMLESLGGDDLSALGTAAFRTVGRGAAVARVKVTSLNETRTAVPIGVFAQLAAQNDSDNLSDALLGICQIQSSVSGWKNVLNLNAGIGGRLLETDEELLARMLIDVAHDAMNQTGRRVTSPSTDPIRGIESALRRVPGVIDAIAWDVVGNLHVAVLGGATVDIANMLHDTLPLGIRTAYSGNGTLVTQNVRQLSGHFRLMVFERAIAVSTAVVAAVVVDGDRYPGEDAIQEAIESLTLTRTERPVSERLQLGQNATAIGIICELRKITGVINAQLTVNGTSSVTINEYQYADIDSLDLAIIE